MYFIFLHIDQFALIFKYEDRLMTHLQSGPLGVSCTTLKWVLGFVFLELSSLHISLLNNNLSF